MRKSARRLIAAVCMVAVTHLHAADRPAEWATAVQVEGVPNLYKVSDQLYRCAQPSAVGMGNAKEMGVKTIVSLRAFHSDRDEIGKTGLGYEHLYFKTWHPEEEDVVQFLKIVTDPTRTPVLLHCQHGADRTGTMSAIYRIVVQGWTKEEAVREMTTGDFGFHEVWKNLPPWIMALDVEALKKASGLTHGP
ncbi:MAG: tyrosine-protein phosphatase [Luteolibacter sp.]|uniref:fused DSP-PTPase phosphatase/NAD kinase-like protein n=1 Tax=Luteolibacter sp. TaxID=1962973 RepID=UPI003263A940